MSPSPAGRPDRSLEAATLDDAIANRRSIRRFRPDAVDDTLVREIVDLARRAPSSMDGQPCHFVVVRDPATRRRLVAIKNLHCPPDKRYFPADFLADAPVVIVVCVDRTRAHEREVEDAALATGFLLLAAESRGLGGVYMTARRDGDPGLADEMRALLALPPHVEPITIVPLGYPGTTPSEKTLRPLEEIVHDEQFDAVRARRR